MSAEMSQQTQENKKENITKSFCLLESSGFRLRTDCRRPTRTHRLWMMECFSPIFLIGPFIHSNLCQVQLNSSDINVVSSWMREVMCANATAPDHSLAHLFIRPRSRCRFQLKLLKLLSSIFTQSEFVVIANYGLAKGLISNQI